ncbi:MAG: cytochrome c [Betaproteobacteria bacterium]
MHFSWRLAAGTLVLGLVAASASAQEIKPERAIKYRQGVLGAMGWHFGILGSMAKGEQPYDKDVALRSATFVQQLSHMPWDGFVAGSDKGAPTKARPEVWKEPAKFKERQQALMAATPKLVTAANTGDVAQLRTAVGSVGGACKDCHDDFREK